MMRRPVVMLLGFLLMLMATATASAQTDVAALNEENARLLEELQTLMTKKKALSDNIKVQEGELKTLTSDIKKEEKTLAKNQGKTDNSKVQELQQQKTALQTSIDDYVQKIQEKEASIYQLDKRLDALKNRMKSLETIRDDVGKDFIEKHRDYIEQAFSTMKSEQLTAIKTDCDKYASDKNVKDFAKQVDKVIGWKQSYDKAVKVVSQRYIRTDVEQALNALPTMGLNSVQAEEINTVRTELQNYEKGISTFQEFIKAVNAKQGIIFSRNDLDDELGIIFGKNNLKQRIMTTVETVPYLKDKYNEYLKAIRSNPGKPTKVEEEILGIRL